MREVGCWTKKTVFLIYASNNEASTYTKGFRYVSKILGTAVNVEADTDSLRKAERERERGRERERRETDRQTDR